MDKIIEQHTRIHAYKHDGRLHRIWDVATVLYQDDQMLITGNEKTRVTEHDGRVWYTKEPAICFFFKNYWFNIIAMMKKKGIQYYCNISSPYLFDGEAIKYIDYDLDFKVFPDGKYILLDKKEYEENKEKMSYPKDVIEKVTNHTELLRNKINQPAFPFDESIVLKYYQVFETVMSSKKGPTGR